MEYKKVFVSGIECIVWDFVESDLSDQKAVDKEKARRRKLKDTLGKDLKDIPLLDSTTGMQGKEYCDAIVYSDVINLWEELFTETYQKEGYTRSKHIINGGCQLHWSKDDTLAVTVSFYRNKFMAQPGRMNEQNLLDWIQVFGSLKSKVEAPVVSEDTSFQIDESEKHDDCMSRMKGKENSDEQWNQLDMSDLWTDDNTVVKQRIRDIQISEPIKIDLTLCERQTSTPTTNSNTDNDNCETVVKDNKIETDTDWIDATDYTPAQTPKLLREKSTPLSKKISEDRKSTRSIKMEFEKMNRILDHINNQAVKHHEELYGWKREWQQNSKVWKKDYKM